MPYMITLHASMLIPCAIFLVVIGTYVEYWFTGKFPHE